MANITEFIKETLNPRLFEIADIVFPEMEFVRYGGGWASRHKLDLSLDERRDKCVITRGRWSHRILEQGGETKDFLSFYMEIHSLSFKDALLALCRIAGEEPPTMEGEEDYRKYQERQNRLEAVNRKMRKDLLNAKEALSYLREERGFSEEFIKWAEFGFVSSGTLEELRELLSYTNKEGREIALPNGVGEEYVLSLPYRSGEYVHGFVFRSLRDIKPKYKDAFISETDTKKYHLFGLTGLNLNGTGRGEKGIVAVEGEFDALRAAFAGVPNVVAFAGGNISPEALKGAKRRGAEFVTILFDSEATDEEQARTDKKVLKAIDTIQEEGLSAFVAEFPQTDGKTDADSFLRDHSGEELRRIIEEGAVFSSRWKYLRFAVDEFENSPKDGDMNTDKALHAFRKETIRLANDRLIPPSERDIIFKDFELRTGGEITKESIEEEADALRAAEARDRQRTETESLSLEAYRLASKGKTEEALSLLRNKLGAVQNISKEAEYNSLLHLPTIEEIRRKYRNKPTGIPTDYFFEGEKSVERLILPSGALTYICAPTSHGKTRFMENLALQTARGKGEGDTLYFSYEEDEEAINLELLNIYANMKLSENNLRTLKTYYHTGEERYFTEGVLEDFKRKETEYYALRTPTSEGDASGKLKVFYRGEYNGEDLVEAIRFYGKHRKIRAVFIDYMQLLHTEGASKKDQLEKICGFLISLANETGFPIVVGSQLNREAYSPVEMAAQNISDASNIEHSANTIILLWNSRIAPLPKSTDYYLDKKGKLTPEAERIAAKGFEIKKGGKMYALIAKNRGGEKDTEAVFDFNQNTGCISNAEYMKSLLFEEGLPNGN